MTSTDETTDPSLIERTCKAVRQGNAAQVCLCLGISNTIKDEGDLDQSLLHTPSKAPQDFYSALFLSKQQLSMDTAQCLIRALLYIPPRYEIPYKTALAVIGSFLLQNDDNNEKNSSSVSLLTTTSRRTAWTLLTDVQTFLQQSVASWLIPRNPSTTVLPPLVNNNAAATGNTTPREMLQQLATAMIQPLFVEETENVNTKKNQQLWLLPLEQLLPSLLSLCRAIPQDDDEDVRNYILSKMYPPKQEPQPCGDRLLPWLNLSLQIKSHLQDEHHDCLRRVLYMNLRQDCAIPSDDYPGLIETVVSFLASSTENTIIAANDTSQPPSWHELVLYLLHACSKQPASTFSTAETVLKSCISVLSTRVLHTWMDRAQLSLEDGVPAWVHANLQLMLLQATDQSGSQLVSNLVARAMKSGSTTTTKKVGDNDDLRKRGWNVLQRLVFSTCQTRVSKRRNHDALQEAQNMLQHVCYAQQDEVVAVNAQAPQASMKMSLQCTRIICDSLFLGHPANDESVSNRALQFASSERAQLWVHAAQTIVFDNKSSYSLTCHDVLLAVWIVVVTYMEVPASRTSLVRTMMQSVGDSGNDMTTTNKTNSTLFCIMLSVLVRSLCRLSNTANNNRHGIVQRMMDDLHPVADTFSLPLSKHVFCRLASALSPLFCARAALLSACRKKLYSPMFAFWWGDTTRGSQDCHDRITSALYGLCELIQSQDDSLLLDECGKEATMLISDVIVLNQKPVLFVPARTWLYQHLAERVEQNQFSKEMKRHLLRACLTCFLRYFGTTRNNQSLLLVPERAFAFWGSIDGKAKQNVSPREDLVSLLHLIILLVPCGDRSGTSAMLRGRDSLVDMLHGRKEQVEVPMKVLVENSQDANVVSEVIAVACLRGVLQCLLHRSNALEKSLYQSDTLRDSETEHDLDIWMQKKLIEIEQECSRVDREGYQPKWVDSYSSSISTSSVRPAETVDPKVLNPVLSSLCDLISKVIVDLNWSSSAANDYSEEDDDELKRVSKCINALVRMKSSYSDKVSLGDNLKPMDDNRARAGFNREAILVTAGIVFEVSSLLLKNLDKHSLNDVDELLQSVLEYCDSLSALIESGGDENRGKKESIEFVHSTKSLWKLYLTIGNDESSKRFIRFLEERRSQCPSSSTSRFILGRRGKYKFSLMTLKSSKDVDEAVRHVRLLLSSTLLRLLTAIPIQEISSDPKSSIKNDSESLHSVLPIGFWTDCLQTFALDLKFGLKGDSGGLTSRMFSTFLDIIEGSTNTILSTYQLSEDAVMQVARDTWAVGREAAILLWHVVCTVPLKFSQTFRKTLMLVLHSLPSLYRIFGGPRLTRDEERPGGGLDELCNFSVLVFEQCFTLLRKLDGLDRATPWIEVAGSDHTGKIQGKGVADKGIKDDSSKSSYDSPVQLPGERSQLRIPSVITIPAQPDDAGNFDEDLAIPLKEGKLRLSSQKEWGWAFSCSLLAMEKNWAECFHLMHGNGLDVEGGTPDEKRNRIIEYSVARVKELSETFKCICLVLSSSCDGDKPPRVADLYKDEPRTGKTNHAVLAAKLPKECKLRLCSLLEKISMVLKSAVRNLISHSKRSYKGSHDIVDSSIVESLTCLAAWLFERNDSVDFTVGTRRWYHSEKQIRKSTQRLAKGVHVPNEPILGRLPKTLAHIEELETTVQKLYAIARKSPGNAIRELDELLCDIHQDESEIYNDETNSSLCGLISHKLTQSVDSSTKMEDFGVAFIDDSEESGVEESGQKRKRSRRNTMVEKRLRKERRRRVVRSRNPVVDEMLQRDIEAGHDDGNDMDDAFIDLEDFLMEG